MPSFASVAWLCQRAKRARAWTMQLEVMPIGKAPVLGTGESRFDSGHLDHRTPHDATGVAARLSSE